MGQAEERKERLAYQKETAINNFTLLGVSKAGKGRSDGSFKVR